MSSQPGSVPRRRLFALLAVAAAAGCTSDQQRVLPSPTGGTARSTTAGPTAPRPTPTGRPSAPAPPPTTAPPDPQLAQLRTELALVAAYDAAARAHPDLAAALAGIRGNHAAHVDALRGLIGPSASTALPSASSAAPISTTSGPSASGSGGPADAARSALSALEATAAADYAAAAITAAPGRAALLGSIAACERTHPGLLGGSPDLVSVPALSGVGADDVAALQDALAAEHVVVWGYDVVGGQSDAAHGPAVAAAQRRHTDLVTLLATAIAAQHQTPVAPQAGYQLPFAVSGQIGAIKLAIHLEDGAAAAWRYLLSRVTVPGVRRTAVAALADCAVQSVTWRAAAGPPLPGIASS